MLYKKSKENHPWLPDRSKDFWKSLKTSGKLKAWDTRPLRVELSIICCIHDPALQDQAERCRHGNMGVFHSLGRRLLEERWDLMGVNRWQHWMKRHVCTDKWRKSENEVDEAISKSISKYSWDNGQLNWLESSNITELSLDGVGFWGKHMSVLHFFTGWNWEWKTKGRTWEDMCHLVWPLTRLSGEPQPNKSLVFFATFRSKFLSYFGVSLSRHQTRYNHRKTSSNTCIFIFLLSICLKWHSK